MYLCQEPSQGFLRKAGSILQLRQDRHFWTPSLPFGVWGIGVSFTCNNLVFCSGLSQLSVSGGCLFLSLRLLCGKLHDHFQSLVLFNH